MISGLFQFVLTTVCWWDCLCVCGTDRSPDIENYWEDDDDSFSSEQEGSDDAVPPQVTDSQLTQHTTCLTAQVELVTVVTAPFHLGGNQKEPDAMQLACQYTLAYKVLAWKISQLC